MLKMLKNNFSVLVRARFLLCSLILLAGFVIYETAVLYGKKWSAVQPLENVMTLGIYLFVTMMFISYEYLRKFYNSGVSEVLQTLDTKNKNTVVAFLVLVLYSFILCVILTLIVIAEFLFFKISDPNHEYIRHIIICIFLNIYLVMQLAIMIGGSLAVLRNRIVIYSIMTMMTLLSSPFAESMAYSIDMSDLTNHGSAGEMAFKFISYFYIIPRFHMKWITRPEFGEPVLLYRVFIILFWSFFFAAIMLIVRKKKCISIVVSGMLCVMMFVGYSLPASKMDQKLDGYQNGIPDIIYAKSDKYDEQIEPADYEIKEYDMKLDIRSSLKAEIAMTVSKTLDQYHMTLYRKYKISEVKDQEGSKLDFDQSGDYVTVFNRNGSDIKKIIIKMMGNSSDCYANYQGCYLPGFYLYYPRAGFLSVYDTTYGNIKPNFVDANTLFKVEVSPEGKYISNLKKEDNEYIGRCDGFTLLKGFYKEKNLVNGNVLVYPYLDEFVVHDGKKSEEECWKENFDFSSEQLKKDNIKDSMIFMDPDVLSGEEYKACGNRQIFVNVGGSFYVSDK